MYGICAVWFQGSMSRRWSGNVWDMGGFLSKGLLVDPIGGSVLGGV